MSFINKPVKLNNEVNKMKWCAIIFFIKVVWIREMSANDNVCTKEMDSCVNENFPRTETPLGKIKGFYKVSYERRKYEAYEGIPYALPPTGERRFQPPQAYKSWDHEIDASKEPNNCTQVDYLKEILVVGDEDCLYLNIYTPRRQDSPLLPVLFWIHGGAYQWGAGTERRAKYLMDRDLILVTINYRLGVYGFLSTGDEVISGNMGLKDQSMALRWISENIQYFGGDPKRITIAGDSAGASSVQYHYLSPMSAGLFQSGISFSGDALANWAFNDIEDASSNKEIFAKATNCPFEDSKSLAECLNRKSASEIRDSIEKLLKSQYNRLRINMTLFKPTVEQVSQNYFINQTPLEILTSGRVNDVPWITGHVSGEGLWGMSEWMLDEKMMSYVDKNWENLAPYILLSVKTIPKDKYAEFANVTRTHYFGDKTISKDTIREFANVKGDRNAILYTEKAAKFQAKVNQNPVYYYYYTYRAAQSFSDYLSKTTINFGVCHLDDIFFFLENDFINPTTTAEDRAMLKDILDFWYSIINTGKPNFEFTWPRVNYSSDNLEYLHIAGPNNFTVHSTDNFGEKQFWRSIGFDV